MRRTDTLQRIHRMLDDKNLTLTWLAKRTDIPIGTIRNWFAHGRMPKADQLVTIARALGTTAEYLVLGDSPGETLSPARQRWLAVMDNKTDEEIETALTALNGFLSYYCRS